MKTAIVTGVSGQDASWTPGNWFCCSKSFKSFQGLSCHWTRMKCSGIDSFKGYLLQANRDGKNQIDLASSLAISKEAVCMFLKRHEIVFVRNGSWNSGTVGAQVAWNKGLTKEDPRVAAYGKAQSITKRNSSSATSLNSTVRSMPEYKEWRRKVFIRDNYASAISGNSGTLNAHHKRRLDDLLSEFAIADSRATSLNQLTVLDGLRDFSPLWDVSNGITLLEEEHKLFHSKELSMKTAVITGVSGQDGSYLAEYLLGRGYTVIGIDRRKSTLPGLSANTIGFSDDPNFISLFGDIKDASFINRVVQEYHPAKYFHLAAMSHVGQSFKEPLETFDTNARAVLIALDAIRRNSPETRYYQASTSELFGGIECPNTGYTEDSPFYPRSPYGVAKLAAYWAVRNYREAYGLFASNGLLFNHESPRRGSDFVTRKITLGVSAIAQGKADTISLGNIDARRDWGFAGDYVQAMDLMLDAHEPGDFVVATGVSISVRDFLRSAIRHAGLDDEAWEKYVDYDPRFMRPSEVSNLLGNPTKINQVLGWKAMHTVDDLVRMMVKSDLVQ